MRILICTNSLGAHGGIERITIVKANALAEIKDNVVGVCYTDKGQYPENTIHPVSEKVQVFDLGVTFWDLYPLTPKNILFNATKKFYNLRRNLKRLIDEFKPDVVVTTGSYEKYALASIKLKRSIKIREFHFNSQYRRYLGGGRFFKVVEFFEYNILSRMFDMNFTLTKEDLDTNFSGRGNFDYQYNPCTFRRPSEPENTNRGNVVLYVGRLSPEKNVGAIIRIWYKLGERRRDYELWIAGDGSMRDELQSLVESLGIGDSVKFLGFRKDISELMQKSRILALSSIHEGLPLSIIEAMNFGLVPISYATPYGPRDLIEDGKSGILVDYLDEDQFTEKLATLISDDSEILRLSNGAIERCKKYELNKVIFNLMSKYRALISLKRKTYSKNLVFKIHYWK